jgi:hypothetical protein
MRMQLRMRGQGLDLLIETTVAFTVDEQVRCWHNHARLIASGGSSLRSWARHVVSRSQSSAISRRGLHS